jgi:hypothetical protein
MLAPAFFVPFSSGRWQGLSPKFIMASRTILPGTPQGGGVTTSLGGGSKASWGFWKSAH